MIAICPINMPVCKQSYTRNKLTWLRLITIRRATSRFAFKSRRSEEAAPGRRKQVAGFRPDRSTLRRPGPSRMVGAPNYPSAAHLTAAGQGRCSKSTLLLVRHVQHSVHPEKQPRERFMCARCDCARVILLTDPTRPCVSRFRSGTDVRQLAKSAVRCRFVRQADESHEPTDGNVAICAMRRGI